MHAAHSLVLYLVYKTQEPSPFPKLLCVNLALKKPPHLQFASLPSNVSSSKDHITVTSQGPQASLNVLPPNRKTSNGRVEANPLANKSLLKSQPRSDKCPKAYRHYLVRVLWSMHWGQLTKIEEGQMRDSSPK